MRVEIIHASKYGNGKMVADEIQRLMASNGHEASVHHHRQARPKELPPADLYIFGTPARIGKPLGSMRRFIKKVDLPEGTRYALFATHGAPQPNKKTGELPSPEELERWYTSIPVLTEMLSSKGLKKVADVRVFVKELKGPLEDGWQTKVGSFVEQILRER